MHCRQTSTYRLSSNTNTCWDLLFPVETVFHTFNPSSVSAQSQDVVFDTGTPEMLYSFESAIYAMDEFDVNEKLKINIYCLSDNFHYTHL